MPLDPPTPVIPLPAAPPAAAKTGGANRVRQTARAFEAAFMTEMLRHARPQSHARGNFAPGAGEKSWSVFMDQALGEAAVARGGSGLSRDIERSMGLSSVPATRPAEKRK